MCCCVTVIPPRSTLKFVLTFDLVYNDFASNTAFWETLRALLETDSFLGRFTSNFVRVDQIDVRSAYDYIS